MGRCPKPIGLSWCDVFVFDMTIRQSSVMYGETRLYDACAPHGRNCLHITETRHDTYVRSYYSCSDISNSYIVTRWYIDKNTYLNNNTKHNYNIKCYKCIYLLCIIIYSCIMVAISNIIFLLFAIYLCTLYRKEIGHFSST